MSDLATLTPARDLSAVSSAAGLLNTTPKGQEIVALLRRLGFWLGEGSGQAPPRHCKPFPVNISNLSSDQIGDLHGYWTSEFARVVALIGALSREKATLGLELKRARARAMGEVLRDAKTTGEKPPTAGPLSAAVDLNEKVIEIEDDLAFIDGLIVALDATKEAVDSYCRVTSREISRRGDLLKARISDR